MIFLRFTFNDEHSETYALDTLLKIEDNEFDTTFLFIHGQFRFRIDPDEFYSKVFSDENEIKEYCLVELHEDDDFIANLPLDDLI